MKKFLFALGLLLAAVLPASAQAARTVLSAPTTFYIATTGTDTPGCGVTSGSPCLTRQFMWAQLVAGYDLACQPVTIQVAAGTYTDPFFASGSPLGLCSLFQMVGWPGDYQPIPLSNILQITFAGQGTVTLQPSLGPAFFAENGAYFAIQGFLIDGTNAAWSPATGANGLLGVSAGSALAISGDLTIGCAPNQTMIQVGTFGTVWVFSSFHINPQTVCAGGSVANPVFFVQQDPFSYVFWEGGVPGITPHITVAMNEIAFSAGFFACNGADLVLAPGSDVPSFTAAYFSLPSGIPTVLIPPGANQCQVSPSPSAVVIN